MMSVADIHWAQPWWLLLLPCCAILLILRVRASAGDRAAPPGPVLRHPDLHGLLAAPSASRGRIWPRMIPPLALACGVIALAQPQRLGGWSTPPPEGRDIVILLDTSLTMSLQDMVWNGKPAERLAVVKRVFSRFAKARVGDRFGIIVFGSRAATLLPPTFDNLTASRMVERARIGVLGDNTALGDAIGLALRQITPRSGLKPVLILYSDNGTSNAGQVSPAQAVAVARHLGVKIFSVQVGGDPAKGRPYKVSSYEGEQPDMRLIASETGGRFSYAASTGAERAAIRTIGTIVPRLRPPGGRHRLATALYSGPLAVAALLWLLGGIWQADRSR
ncbi:MAG: VWA domain-containing protein [Acidiphilium sp.]|nr:VWA domain-containing protein [Acidiphilium sp.]